VHPPKFQWEITGPLYEFYQRKHGVKFTELKTADEALAQFKSSAKGYVVWDRAVSASLNVAFTIAGLEDAVVVSEELIPLVEKHGLKPIDDLRGRYTGQTDDVIYGMRMTVTGPAAPRTAFCSWVDMSAPSACRPWPTGACA
jgi:hypothetical protein